MAEGPGGYATTMATADDDAVRPTPTPPVDHEVRRTRASRAWVTLSATAVLAIALVIFIVQNSQSVRIRFVTVSGSVPLAAGLLAAAVLGALVLLIPGATRMAQLRRAAGRHRRHDRDQSRRADQTPPKSGRI